MLLHVQTVLAQGPAGAATRRRSRETRRTGALGLAGRTLALTHRRRQRSIIWHPPLASAEGFRHGTPSAGRRVRGVGTDASLLRRGTPGETPATVGAGIDAG